MTNHGGVIMKNEYINMKISSLQQDIEMLKNNQIYEHDNVPGVPSAATLGHRIEDKLNEILRLFEEIEPK